MLKIALSFDYDSPTGYRQSFHMRNFPGNADQEGAEILLKILGDHGVRATFGIVGRAALEGTAPEHCPEQIRKIHTAGHEIASHSMSHLFLPAASDRQLAMELVESKNALQECTGSSVTGFIPPFNCPTHFPSRGAFSVSEFLGLHGRGRGRQSIEKMFAALCVAGYAWARVVFRPKVEQVLQQLRIIGKPPPLQPFLFHDIVAIPLHATGFGIPSRALIRQSLGTELVLAIYGHPNQALSENDQNASKLDELIEEFERERAAGELEFITMQEVEEFIRQNRAERARRTSDLNTVPGNARFIN